jgi:IS605 OrfB family transposase
VTRAVKFKLDHLSQRKQAKIRVMLEAYRSAVNFYTQSFWKSPGQFDGATERRLDLAKTRLPARFRSAAFKQALKMVDSVHALSYLQETQSCPTLKGAATLDAKQLLAMPGTKGVGQIKSDYAVRLMTLKKGSPITFPLKSNPLLKRWLSKPGAKLLGGGNLTETHLTLWVEIPTPALPKKPEIAKLKAGAVVGLDLGLNKLVATSSGEFFGLELKPILAKIRRRKPGSKGRKRAYAERENYIGQTLNQVDFSRFRVVGVEDLKDMKRGKRGRRGKKFRKTLAPWVYSRVLQRIRHKAEECGALLVAVPPAHTSQTCPSCGGVHKSNRQGENFLCTSCGHAADADYVGAQNVLARTWLELGSLEPPRLGEHTAVKAA